MSRSNIEWTDATWNPVVGCTPVSAGCANCYAARMTYRLEQMGQPEYRGLTTLQPNGRRHFNGTVRCIDERLALPLRWRKPRRVFVNSMSDLFHEDVPFDFIDRVFAVMALCPQHTFQVLTKRPERMAEYSCEPRRSERVYDAQGRLGAAPSKRVARFPLPNVWIGTSVENQQAADERIPHLLRCPAAVRFLSCEPLLGPVDLYSLRSTTTHHFGLSVSGALRNKSFDGLTDDSGRPLSRREAESELRRLDAAGVKLICCSDKCNGFSDQTGCPGHRTEGIDWVIVGGESGPGARPMQTEWARSIRDQCAAAGVPFFFKQWGEYNAAGKRVGKKAAGALQGGREHREYPQVTQ